MVLVTYTAREQYVKTVSLSVCLVSSGLAYVLYQSGLCVSLACLASLSFVCLSGLCVHLGLSVLCLSGSLSVYM